MSDPKPGSIRNVYAAEIQPGDVVVGFEDCGPVTGVEESPDHVGLRWGEEAGWRIQIHAGEAKQVYR
jgi:hypothetical protein